MKNKILKVVTSIVGFLWLVSVCAIDSASWIPTIICAICSAYLILFAYANNWFEDYYD